MLCNKCGKEIPEGAPSCPECGSLLTGKNAEGADAAKSGAETAVPASEDAAVKKKSSPVPFIIGGIAAVALLVVIVTGLAALSSPQRKYEKQLSLGGRYLEELDYDRAIAAYRTAIEIDSKNPDAYEALAEIYMEMEEPDKALAVLKEGIDETADERLEVLYAQIEEQMLNALTEVESDDNIENDDVEGEESEVTDADGTELDDAEQDADDVADDEYAEQEDDEAGTVDEEQDESVSDDTAMEDEEQNTADEGESSYIRNGDYVVFGNYEQDGNTANGPEPIEWEIVADEGDRMLLISRYILDYQPYNTERIDVTWENCSLRNWLNSDFYNTAFTTMEQSMIITANLSNPNNVANGAKGGNNTSDNIFLFSVDEIMRYYTFNIWNESSQWGGCQQLITESTLYAEGKGARNEIMTQDEYNSNWEWRGYTEDVVGKKGFFWWLRSPGHGYNGNFVACSVYPDGRAGWDIGNYVFDDTKFTLLGVRPALYLEK